MLLSVFNHMNERLFVLKQYHCSFLKTAPAFVGLRSLGLCQWPSSGGSSPGEKMPA